MCNIFLQFKVVGCHYSDFQIILGVMENNRLYEILKLAALIYYFKVAVAKIRKISGLELSFYSGVYSSSIGFTKNFGEIAKQLVGLSGIFIGVGEVLGRYHPFSGILNYVKPNRF